MDLRQKEFNDLIREINFGNIDDKVDLTMIELPAFEYTVQ
jgi:hypothetical protein